MSLASKPCPVCEMAYQPSRRNQVYCSHSCKQQAYRDRKVAGSVAGGEGPGPVSNMASMAGVTSGPTAGAAGHVTAVPLSPKRLKVYALVAALVLVAVAAAAVYMVWSLLVN